MGRLTIEQIIEHCEKTTKEYEEKVSDLFPIERTQSNRYWEHKQVAEYLKELQKYKDLEEQGKLYILPCLPNEPVYVSIKKYAFEGTIPGHYIYKDFYGIIRDLQAGYIIGYTIEEVESKLEELKGE